MNKVYFGLQLKIDEFESNVNEVKDPFPPADFPGKTESLQHMGLNIIGGLCTSQKRWLRPHGTALNM